LRGRRGDRTPRARAAAVRDPRRAADLLRHRQLRLRLRQQQGRGHAGRSALRAGAHAGAGVPTVREEPRPACRLPAAGAARCRGAPPSRAPGRPLGFARGAADDRRLSRHNDAAVGAACARALRPRHGSAMTARAPAMTTRAATPARVSLREWREHFLSLLRPYRTRLGRAHPALLLDSLLAVMRPWPLKVVIDRVISEKPSRVPFLGHWLDHVALDRTQVLYGACATSLLIALGTGLSTLYYRRAMGSIGKHFTF